MADRTQTLSAALEKLASEYEEFASEEHEAHDHAGEFAECPVQSCVGPRYDLKQARFALSQPEQGETPSEGLDDLREIVDRVCMAASKGDSPESLAAYLWSNISAHLSAAEQHGETPSLVLSDGVVPQAARDAAYRAVRATAKRRNHHAPEPDSVGLQQFAHAAVDAALPYLPVVLGADEIRRLENIAHLIEVAPAGDQDAAKETASFLRNLASQEHRGGEEKRREPASADEVRGILKGYEAPEQPWAPEPDVDLDPMHGMGAHEAWMDGWAKGHAAAAQPSTGEAARLREQLLDFIFGEYDLLDRDHGWPAKRDEFEAAFPPPSDSQGGQGEEKAALDAEFDAAIQQSEGTEGHRLKITFDGGPRVELIHPERGCRPPTQCVHCAADLTDPETKRCYDCKGIDPEKEECWLTAWVDEQGDELVRGSVTLPVAATWETDYPLFHLPVVPATDTSKEER